MLAIPASTSFTPPTAGEIVSGRYRLDRPLGEGGMGRVWLAHNEALDKDIAIKFLRTDLTAPDASARFEREARVTACVEHPAVVRVFDFGEHDGGTPFIVMERLEGQTLASLLDSAGRLPAVDAVRILLPVIDGLAKVHELGIIHRDIKPENVFLAAEAGRLQPKLLDFGIARLEEDTERPVDPRLTLQGAVLGSPSYMSPEQARGQRDVDGRTDVWGMCILIYEVISGACPFGGENYNAILTSIIEQPVPPLAESVEDAGIWAILRRGLAKDREDRIPSMRELGQALASWLVMRGLSTDIHGNSLHESWGVPTEKGSAGARHLPEATLPSLEAPEPLPEEDFGWPRSAAPVAMARKKGRWVPAGIVSMAAAAASLWLVLGLRGPAFADYTGETDEIGETGASSTTDRGSAASPYDRGEADRGEVQQPATAARSSAPVATTAADCAVDEHLPGSEHTNAAMPAPPAGIQGPVRRPRSASAPSSPKPSTAALDLKEPY